MKKKLKNVLFIFIMICTVVLAGCKNKELASSQTAEKKVEKFPETIERNLAENININAKCVYPDKCKYGNAMKAKLGKNFFWDKKDEIAKLCFGNREIEERYENDYGDVQEINFLTDDAQTVLQISSNNYLTYTTQKALDIQNVISTDSRYDGYNGDRYQNISDLSFMTQDEAWSNIQGFLGKLGIECSESYKCYVMEHNVMEEEQKKIISREEELGEKIPDKEKQWSADDDCYYFMTYISWEGVPVLPFIQGEGTDEDNVTVIYNRDGIIGLNIDGYFSLEYEEDIKIQSPENVVEKIKSFLEKIISQDFYEVKKITLCQKVTGIDFDKRKAEIVPVWECRIAIKTPDEENMSYIQKIYFNAETLEIVQ